jgi:CDP-diacylglycerol--serine O-phosphatidyltransferase
MFSMKFKSFGWSGNEKRIIFIIGALVLLIFLQIWAIPIVFLTYVLVGVIGVVIRK